MRFSGYVLRDGVRIWDLDVGSVALRPGDRIDTREGMAEIPLAPGSVLRIGDGSEVTLASGTTDVLPKLNKGSAILEVMSATVAPLAIEQNGASIQAQAAGLYVFNSGRRTVTVCRRMAVLKRDGKEGVLPAGREPGCRRISRGSRSHPIPRALSTGGARRARNISVR